MHIGYVHILLHRGLEHPRVLACPWRQRDVYICNFVRGGLPSPTVWAPDSKNLVSIAAQSPPETLLGKQ